MRLLANGFVLSQVRAKPYAAKVSDSQPDVYVRHVDT
jgi:hypothetical protein